ncbi:DNA polymerase III subunit delta' [Phaeovibrio sulfidiphilus]|uniref:DNA polymerase III subunit delta n=1 Tax=Phaeovibrio sulfidiphilus TaxID=1220600 RepID=A0A8J6Z0F5_9PROT|nr:DNA polymerase III subunit delta' [Phaeovibrio sulfidiphilus]
MSTGFPQPFETTDLLGHADAEATFLAALASGRMAHGWLLAGPAGVGKATLAYRMARALLAHGERATTLDIPETDPVFVRVRGRTHGNLLVVERGAMKSDPSRRSETIDVESVRAVGEFLSLSSAEGGWRVVIVDEAETMNTSSANALLKVLEEPPPRCALLLVSHNAGRLLPTIRSRVRTLTLKPLPPQAMESLFARHLPGLDPRKRAVLAGLAEGSIGRALALSAHLDDWEKVLELLRSAPAFPTAALHELGEAVAKKQELFDALSDLLPWWLARLARSGAGDASGASARAGDEDRIWQHFLEAAPLDQWVDVWENTGTLFRKARALHLDRKQTVLSVFHLIGRTLASGPAGAGAPDLRR